MKPFQCVMCGECCRGEGGILLKDEETGRIAVFLDISPESFLSGYCEKRNGRNYIKTGEDGFCIFFHREKQCLIHPVKPDICSLWPYYDAIVSDPDNWRAAQDACPGINPDCTFEKFVRDSGREFKADTPSLKRKGTEKS